MKNVKKIAALGLSATMAMGMLPATLVSADEATGTVYYLNFKPEQAGQWKELAEKYTEETGVQVDVVTAASGTYESKCCNFLYIFHFEIPLSFIK